jgi:hypothetical protein
MGEDAEPGSLRGGAFPPNIFEYVNLLLYTTTSCYASLIGDYLWDSRAEGHFGFGQYLLYSSFPAYGEYSG